MFPIWKHRTGLQQGGGLAFLIRNDVHHGHKTLNVLNNGKLEVQAIKIIANSVLTIDLLNLYKPNENIPCSEYDFYFKRLDTNLIIVGDFYCHHRMLDTRKPSNTAGVNLVDALVLHPFITLLTPISRPTYYIQY